MRNDFKTSKQEMVEMGNKIRNEVRNEMENELDKLKSFLMES